jgi:ABC-type antimicrobial peptide transport system permease subunit
VLGEVSIMIGIGLAAGIAGAALTARLFASLLYGVGPNDPYTVATAAGVLALIAGIAGYLPARRAARVDPMAALRHD